MACWAHFSTALTPVGGTSDRTRPAPPRPHHPPPLRRGGHRRAARRGMVGSRRSPVAWAVRGGPAGEWDNDGHPLPSPPLLPLWWSRRARRVCPTTTRLARPRAEHSVPALTWRDGGVPSPQPRRRGRRLAVGVAAGSTGGAAALKRGRVGDGAAYGGNVHGRSRGRRGSSNGRHGPLLTDCGSGRVDVSPPPRSPKHRAWNGRRARLRGGGRGEGRRSAPLPKRDAAWASSLPTLPAPSYSGCAEARIRLNAKRRSSAFRADAKFQRSHRGRPRSAPHCHQPSPSPPVGTLMLPAHEAGASVRRPPRRHVHRARMGRRQGATSFP